MPTPKKEPAARQPKKSEAGQPQDPQTSPNLEQLQQEFNNEYLLCLQAVEQGRTAQQQLYADAYNELLTAVQKLRQEVMDRGSEALQNFAGSLQTGTGNRESYDKCVDAYHAYLDAMQQVVAGRGEAEQSVVQAYQEYTTAVQGGKDEAEVKRLAERAQQVYLDANSSSSRQTEMLQQAVEAQANFNRLLQETQTSGQQAAVDAYRTYVGQLRESLEQVNVQERYQSALQQYQNRVNEITTGTQRLLLETNTKALRELRSAWETLAGGAIRVV
jgi:hypothetical protein